MKIAVQISRIIVGLLFIFSGLVKANDPHGLAYKMQEFFEVWGVHGFDSFTLPLAVLMNAFEIIAGFALLLGWAIPLFSWLLLLLIVFFTFLTGYTYATGKPANCGCFGDCLPISSKTSFLKDVILTVLILFLVWKRKYIRPLFASRPNTFSMVAVILFAFGFQWYTLNYLPVVDCLPYKKGKNIAKQMEMPADAVAGVTEIRFTYEKDGKQMQFTAANFPADFDDSYKLIKREEHVVREPYHNVPPITGFSLVGHNDITDTLTGETKRSDSTAIILQQPTVILLFCEDFEVSTSHWMTTFKKIYEKATAAQVPVYIVTSEQVKGDKVMATAGLPIQVFACDRTAIRMAARSNPCLYLLKNGTIAGKWSAKTMKNVITQLDEKP